MQQYIFEISYREPEKIFSIFADEHGAVFLDSADTKSPHSGYSFIGFFPVEKIIHRDGKTEITTTEFSLKFRNNPFQVVQKRLAAWKEFSDLSPKSPLPFTNGAIGYFSYELARFFEKLPQLAMDDMDLPDMALGIYDQVIGFDVRAKKAWFCTIAANKKKAEARLDILKARLSNFKYHLPNTTKPEWERTKSRAEYKEDIQTIIDYIHAGDVFQVNLSQRFTAHVPDNFNAYAHYLSLRRINPAPFSAYLKFEDLILSSSSPERFLKVTGNEIETRPIKGTLAANEDPAILLKSEKDRAENTMIVDLLRNDLSKICTPDSITVPELCVVESYSGLHHLVSSVKGVLKPGMSSLDALAACFPGGSITGAPKIRAMEIIEELEPSRRGPYCGAIGYIGLNGSMDTNIAIRTLVYKGNHVSLNIGGGIVADSDLEAEYQETLVKGRKIFESFEVDRKEAPIEKTA